MVKEGKRTEQERRLRAVEKLLGLSLTIIDFNGRFRSDGKYVFFSHYRQSHQKNPVCDKGFCQKCIDHCRHEVGRKAVEAREPFVHQCWKGVAEIVVPLYLDGVFAGQLFAGQWQSPQAGKRSNATRLLPPLPPQEKLQELMLVLSAFSAGLMLGLQNNEPEKSLSREQQVKRFIRREYPKALTLEDLAHYLGVSTSRASHIAAQGGKGSFQQRLLRQRLEASCVLLCSGDMRINEVAAAVGFKDPYYFSRMFRREYQCSPSCYRQKNSRSL